MQPRDLVVERERKLDIRFIEGLRYDRKTPETQWQQDGRAPCALRR
jgi:hypothetical protein